MEGTKPTLLPKPGKIKVFQAICSYEKRMNDELSFAEGDFIYVMEQSSDGWWKAKCNGKIGLIPNTYVTEKEEVRNPLHDAVRRGNISFLQECLSQGVSHTSLDAMSNTALYWAAASGHTECLTLLLSYPNPPLNAQNHSGDTALHAASARGHAAIVEILLSHGAMVSVTNTNGETAEDLAKNLAIRNLLQSARNFSNQLSSSTYYDPNEYDDDSDS